MSACRGECGGDRSALEPPARMVVHGGERRIACPCCGQFLTRRDEWQRTAEGLAVPARPPNLNPQIDAELKVRFSDEACGYDVVVLAGLVPTG